MVYLIFLRNTPIIINQNDAFSEHASPKSPSITDRNPTKDPYARRYLREVKTTTTKFIANSGCILGFCMGFSLISGAEVVFHIVAGLFTKRRLPVRGGEEDIRLKERPDNTKRSHGFEMTVRV